MSTQSSTGIPFVSLIVLAALVVTFWKILLPITGIVLAIWLVKRAR